MGIAELNDRFNYLEEKVEKEGGVEHLKESVEWTEIGGEMAEKIDFLDIYLHKSNYFKATVYKTPEEGEVTKIEVSFTKPKHHFDEEEPLPPIYEEGDGEEYRKYHSRE